MLFYTDDIDFTTILNCCTWLDFSDKSTLTFRTGTDSIQQVNDKSGKNNHFYSTSDVTQPRWIGNLNGKTVAYFNTGKKLESLIDTQGIGILANDFECFFSFKTNASNNLIQFLLANGTINGEYECHIGLASAAGSRFINNQVIVTSLVNVQNTSPHIINIIVSAGSISLSIDGGSLVTTAGNGRSNVNTYLRIGARSNNSYTLNATLSQVLLYNRNLTSQERTAIVRMLQVY
jgi:hypothetical protein